MVIINMSKECYIYRFHYIYVYKGMGVMIAAIVLEEAQTLSPLKVSI